MTLEEFKALSDLQDRRVRMIFNDGQEIVATLISVGTDIDDSRHLVYEKVEGSDSLNFERTYYSRGEELVDCYEIQI